MVLTGGRRAFLLALAVAIAVAVFSLGSTFTYNAEAPARARGSELFWLLLALVFASPLWVPAFLPARLGWVSTGVRWLCAAALLVPLLFAGSVAVHQFGLYPHPLFSVTIFAIAAALSAGCIAAIVVLLAPAAHRLVGEDATDPDLRRTPPSRPLREP
ncbi:MAG: hypothetical protein M3S32_00970 [Acidobacteriota bacterium]|nr:hypothetical protein [Acidobacteriota bacterium]